jgi:hypothetical protein
MVQHYGFSQGILSTPSGRFFGDIKELNLVSFPDINKKCPNGAHQISEGREAFYLPQYKFTQHERQAD